MQVQNGRFCALIYQDKLIILSAYLQSRFELIYTTSRELPSISLISRVSDSSVISGHNKLVGDWTNITVAIVVDIETKIEMQDKIIMPLI